MSKAEDLADDYLNYCKPYWKEYDQKQKHLTMLLKRYRKFNISRLCYLFKKLLFTMENATAAGSSQSNISRLYI